MWRRVTAAEFITISSIAIAGASLFSAIVTARELGPAGRGVVATLQSSVALASAVGLLGMPTLVLRSMRLDRGNGLPRAAFRLSVGVTTVCALGIAGWLLATSQVPLGPPVIVAAVLVSGACVQIAIEFSASQRQAKQQFGVLAFRRFMWSGVTSVCLGASALLGASGLAVVITGVAASAITLLVFGGRDLAMRGTMSVGLLSLITDKLWRTSIRSYGALILLLLIYRLDVLILGILTSASYVGIYSLAYLACELSWIYVNASSVSLSPQLVTAGPIETRKMLHRAQARSTLVVTAGCIGIIAFGKPVIALVLGDQYVDVYWVALCLIPGIVAFVPVKLATTSMIAQGRAKVLPYAFAAILVINVALNLTLVPTFKAQGCAVAASFTYVIAMLLFFRLRK
jgi:O-antigen/teichoic acid export membrane protein